MPQNKLWDFWSKQTMTQNVENPGRNSQDSTSPGSSGNDGAQDVESGPIDTIKVNPEVSEKDELPLIPTFDESSEDWTRGMKGTIFSAIYFFFGSLVLIFFMNFTNERMPRGLNPLPDVGHELIPKMSPEKLGDFTQIALIAAFVTCMILTRGDGKRFPMISKLLNFLSNLYILRTIVGPLKRTGNRWPIVTKFLLTLGNLYLIRSISVYVTSVPSTDNHCRHGYEDIPNIWINTLKGLLTLGSSNIHCGDLMFSGHTCMVTNVWLSLNTNYKKHYIFRIILTILWLMTIIFIIGTRSHYTIDIWIALWLTVFVHAWTPAYFPFTKKNISRVLKNWF